LSQDLLVVVSKDGLLTAVNAAWTQLLGWAEAELLGRHFDSLIHPDDLQPTVVVFAGIFGAPLVTPHECRFRHKDGTWRWFGWTATMQADAVYANGRDTTAIHEREEALQLAESSLRQSQKMEAVGQLTGGLAHDFNNLLAAITGSLELIRRRVAEGRHGELDRYIGMAQGAAKRAAALTHRLLAFSRRQTLEPRPLKLNKLVTDMEEMLRRSIGPAIELEVVAAVGLWGVVADASQVENALLNLCINARDAMPQGGKITIETANRWIDERTAVAKDFDPGQYVSMCVSDNGSGMPAAVVARAFDPFFTTKPIGAGTGLGLSMVYGFARQSGGQARIYSEAGQGTMVCVYLPRKDRDEEAAPAEAAMPAAERAEQGETVLVVDDEPTVRALIIEVLRELGYASLEAGDGAEAMALIESGCRVDLLLTDVGLPGGLNGRQVADAARVLRPSIKVLFITGYAENAVLSHGHLDPGMHVMTKPFELDALARRVRELVSGRID
jgi:PAS domain S-box-containing protein